MQKRPTSATARKWQSYNRWRSKHRALDRQRRLERIAQRKAAFVEGCTVQPAAIPRKTAALHTIIIRNADGTRHQFSINKTPFGPSVSPTVAGQRVTQYLLANK